MNKQRLFFLILFLTLNVTLIISVSADTAGYVIQPATPDMITGPSQELTPVPLWQHPPRVLAIYLALFLTPVLVFPVELFFLLKLITCLGFRQIAKTNVLDNPTRSAIFHYIRESPGTDQADISRKTGIARNTLRYHLAVLKLTNKVTLLETTRNSRYYENAGCYPVVEQKVLKYLHNQPTRLLLQLIRENPGMNRAQLESALGVSGAGINWHMHRLSDDGLLSIRKTGRSARYEIRNEVLPVLEKYLPESRHETLEGKRE